MESAIAAEGDATGAVAAAKDPLPLTHRVPARLPVAAEMLSCRLQCALAALCIVLALGGVTGAPSDPRLRQFLQKSLAAAAGKQVWKCPGLVSLVNSPPSRTLSFAEAPATGVWLALLRVAQPLRETFEVWGPLLLYPDLIRAVGSSYR